MIVIGSAGCEYCVPVEPPPSLGPKVLAGHPNPPVEKDETARVERRRYRIQRIAQRAPYRDRGSGGTIGVTRSVGWSFRSSCKRTSRSVAR